MKHCKHCGARIPDHSNRCPHCRGAHPPATWLFQAFLVALVAATAAVVLLFG